MVRLPPSDSTSLNTILLGQLWTVWTAIIVTVAWLALILISPALCRPSTTFQTYLSPLAEWVKQTGVSTVMRGVVVQALGFPKTDLAVRERGFRQADEQLTHVITVGTQPGYENVVFLALVDESTGDSTVWRGTREGHLDSTARFTNGVAKRIPNEESEHAFEAEKVYFLNHMCAQQFRTAPTASPSVLKPPAQVGSKPVTYIQRQLQSPLQSESLVLLLNPWVLPGVVILLALGSQRVTRRH